MRLLSWRQKKLLFPYFLVMPGVVAVALILVYPLIRGVLASFYVQQPLDLANSQFVGLQHFKELLSDRIFSLSFKNTLIWTSSIVVFQYIFGLITALLLNQDFPGRAFFRSVILIPWVVPSVAAALTWRWIYAEQFGILNHILTSTGILENGIGWLGNTQTAFLSIIIAAIWKGVPFVAIVLLAGLQGISKDIYEASAIAGASVLKQFWYITLPQLKGVSLVTILLTSIWTFNQFDLVWIMTKGGPANSTQILPVYTYLNAFNFFKFNYAAAIASVGVVLLTVFAILYMKLLKAEEGNN